MMLTCKADGHVVERMGLDQAKPAKDPSRLCLSVACRADSGLFSLHAEIQKGQT